MTCTFCQEEVPEDDGLRHLTECQHAPEDVRAEVAEVIRTRAEFAAQPIKCCKMRKKILLKPITMSEAACGIPDSEMADFMTFERFRGLDVVMPKFCPWCGKPWDVEGIKVI